MSSQVMIVTGVASGIGRRTAELLAARGHKLVVTDLNEVGLRDVAQVNGWLDSDKVTLKRLDVRDAAAWDDMVEEAATRYGRVDVMFNIAGYLKPGYIHEVDVSEIDKHLDINAKGLMYGTRAAARLMVGQRSGHIVNIASMAGIAAVPGIGLYSASKHAVRGFSLAVAAELRPHGVFVTAVCPDAVDTPMLDLQKDYDEAAMTFSGPRALSADEVARALAGEVLERKPAEFTIVPPRSGRAALAKLTNVFPELSIRLAPYIVRQGLRGQKRGR